jgi:hypothetical protein
MLKNNSLPYFHLLLDGIAVTGDLRRKIWGGVDRTSFAKENILLIRFFRATTGQGSMKKNCKGFPYHLDVSLPKNFSPLLSSSTRRQIHKPQTNRLSLC